MLQTSCIIRHVAPLRIVIKISRRELRPLVDPDELFGAPPKWALSVTQALVSNHGKRADSNWVRDKPGVLGQCLSVSCFRARGALRSVAFELIDASVAGALH